MPKRVPIDIHCALKVNIKRYTSAESAAVSLLGTPKSVIGEDGERVSPCGGWLLAAVLAKAEVGVSADCCKSSGVGEDDCCESSGEYGGVSSVATT